MDSRKKKHQQQQQQDRFKPLADETVCHVLSYLDTSNLLKTNLVSKRLNFFSRQAYLEKLPLLDYTKPNEVKRLQSNPLMNMTVLTNSLLIGWNYTGIVVIDITSGETIQTIPALRPMTNLVKLADKCVAAAYFNKIYILNYETGEIVKKIKLLNHPLSCTALSGSLLLIGYSVGTFQIWNYKTDQVKTFQSHSYSTVRCVAPLNDKRFVSGHADGNIRIWNYQTGKHTETFESDLWYWEAVQDIVVLSNSLLASGHADGGIRIWDYKKGRCLQIIDDALHSHFKINRKHLHLAKLSDKHLLSIDSGGKMKIWHYDQGKFIKSYENSNKLDVDTYGYAVFNHNQIITSKINKGLELISFPAIKNKIELNYVEIEKEQKNNKCLVM